MRVNKTKAKLKAGQPVFGVSMRHAWLDGIEMAGALGFDFILLNVEHGRMSEETVEHMIKAIDLFGMTPLVRVRGIDEAAFLGYLEAGALGLHIPHTNTVEELQTAVKYTKFYPEGVRGLTRGRPIDMTGSMADFIRDYNRETMIIGMIEDVEAVKNLPQLVKVPGIDGLLVGPSDLAQTMGLPGQPSHPDVVATVNRVVADIGASSMSPGIDATETTVKDWLAKGVKYICVSCDGWFENGARRFLQAARG